MQQLGSISIVGRSVPVLLFATNDVRDEPLDERVIAIATRMRRSEIVVGDFSLPEFLTDDSEGQRSKNARVFMQVWDNLDKEREQKVLTPSKYGLLANSIEDVAIFVFTEVPSLFSCVPLPSPSVVFVPARFLDYMKTDECLMPLVVSSPWKANTVDVFELEHRFDDELEHWRSYDSSRFVSEERNALASLLGMGDTISQMKQTYLYGHAIGEAVGEEHSHQWLPMDLKLEHFIRATEESIAHVDHSDDVMLFREPTTEECAKSIAPLYQQMDYPLWHAFREGYWDIRGKKSLDVLEIFDGWRIGEILGIRSIDNATKLRKSEDWDAALAWYDNAEPAFNLFANGDEGDAHSYLCSLELVRGDLFLQRKEFTMALSFYDKALAKLEELKAKGGDVGFKIASALVNSGATLLELGKPTEARERLLRAKREATTLPKDDPGRGHILKAVSINLERNGL